MSRLKLILPLLSVAALAACATQPPTADLSPAASAPAPTPGYDWIRNTDEPPQQALVYGMAHSDEVKLQLFCRPGSDTLDLAAILDKPARQLRLESGGDTETYRATSEEAAISDGYYAQARAHTKDPVFQRFRRLGWIAVWDGDERHAYAARPAALAEIDRFFAACG